MPSLSEYKSIIFPNPSDEEDFLYFVRDYNRECIDFNAACHWVFHEADDRTLQLCLAPFLRELAIRHLEELLAMDKQNQPEFLQTVLSCDEYGTPEKLREYLRSQRINATYTTDLSAYALAHAFNVQLRLTLVDNKKHYPLPNNEAWCLVKTKPFDFYLYNLYTKEDAKAHFFTQYGAYGSTIGDGNCFYNAIAQNLRRIIRETHFLGATTSASQTTPVHPSNRGGFHETMDPVASLPVLDHAPSTNEQELIDAAEVGNHDLVWRLLWHVMERNKLKQATVVHALYKAISGRSNAHCEKSVAHWIVWESILLFVNTEEMPEQAILSAVLTLAIDEQNCFALDRLFTNNLDVVQVEQGIRHACEKQYWTAVGQLLHLSKDSDFGKALILDVLEQTAGALYSGTDSTELLKIVMGIINLTGKHKLTQEEMDEMLIVAVNDFRSVALLNRILFSDHGNKPSKDGVLAAIRAAAEKDCQEMVSVLLSYDEQRINQKAVGESSTDAIESNRQDVNSVLLPPQSQKIETCPSAVVETTELAAYKEMCAEAYLSLIRMNSKKRLSPKVLHFAQQLRDDFAFNPPRILYEVGKDNVKGWVSSSVPNTIYLNERNRGSFLSDRFCLKGTLLHETIHLAGFAHGTNQEEIAYPLSELVYNQTLPHIVLKAALDMITYQLDVASEAPLYLDAFVTFFYNRRYAFSCAAKSCPVRYSEKLPPNVVGLTPSGDPNLDFVKNHLTAIGTLPAQEKLRRLETAPITDAKNVVGFGVWNKTPASRSVEPIKPGSNVWGFTVS